MYSKHRLWLTIKSLESIPAIDDRLLYADTLQSLNDNIYKIKQVSIPELDSVYNQNYETLKQLLFQKYLNIIKDTQAGLADLVIQDLHDKYQSQITDTYNIYMALPTSQHLIGGNGPDGPPKMAPPPMKFKESKGKEPISTPALPPPPPPPPSMLFSKADYDKLRLKPEKELTKDQLLKLRNYELQTQPVRYTKAKGLQIKLTNTKEAQNNLLKDLKAKFGIDTPTTVISSRSVNRQNRNKDLPPLVQTAKLFPLSKEQPERTITYDDMANVMRHNALTLIEPQTREVCKEMVNLVEDFKIYLTLKAINRSSDNKLLQNRYKLLNEKLKEGKIPVWRYNYEIINYLLSLARPKDNVSEYTSAGLGEYLQLIILLAAYNDIFLQDNSLNNANIQLFKDDDENEK